MSENRRFVVPDVDALELANTELKQVSVQHHFQKRLQSKNPVSGSSSSGNEDVSPPKLPKPSPVVAEPVTTAHTLSKFETAFSDLKNSKHFANCSHVPEKTAESTPVTNTATTTTVAPGRSNSIIVNRRQRGNPVLKHVRSVAWEFGDIIPDYILGPTTAALFLSVRYHNLNPEYIHERLRQLARAYDLRILLVQVDVPDPHHALKELTKISLLADCTMVLAWSAEEAGRYLETYKIFENKPAELLMKKQEADSYSKIVDALTSIKSINRTDAVMLLTRFHTIENIIKASKEELSFCSGMGPLKAARLFDALRQPFLKSAATAGHLNSPE